MDPMKTDTIKRVSLFTGSVAHLIDTAAPPVPDLIGNVSLCNLRPIWPGTWVNGGSADSLPLCKTCEAVRGMTSGDRT